MMGWPNTTQFLAMPLPTSIYEAKHFVLFCHVEISQTTVLHATLLVSLESFQ
jgi:hypothetical protein